MAPFGVHLGASCGIPVEAQQPGAITCMQQCPLFRVVPGTGIRGGTRCARQISSECGAHFETTRPHRTTIIQGSAPASRTIKES